MPRDRLVTKRNITTYNIFSEKVSLGNFKNIKSRTHNNLKIPAVFSIVHCLSGRFQLQKSSTPGLHFKINVNCIPSPPIAYILNSISVK